jgi:hypothetical protein
VGNASRLMKRATRQLSRNERIGARRRLSDAIKGPGAIHALGNCVLNGPIGPQYIGAIESKSLGFSVYVVKCQHRIIARDRFSGYEQKDPAFGRGLLRKLLIATFECGPV